MSLRRRSTVNILGGGALGCYYLLKYMDPTIDAFDPQSIMVFAPSVLTGTPIPGASRYSVVAKSPLGGAIGESQAGGYWGAELKKAGFDAIVISGRARTPVYIWIDNGDVSIRPADRIWGLDTGEAQDLIRRELGDDKVRIVQIGPAGENLVRFASIVNELRHFHGRCGLGAVMGSKKLKAIAVRGRGSVELSDTRKVRDMVREFASTFTSYPSQLGLKELGTGSFAGISSQIGNLPTTNYRFSSFKGSEQLTTMAAQEAGLYAGSEGCYACPIKCKQTVHSTGPIAIDSRYGGPEYESWAALGAYTGVSDTLVVCKANELCARYTLDTISTGATIAFAMECFEKGLLTLEDTGGIELKFGDGEVLLQVIDLIARREGIGDLLAEGSARAALRIGQGAEKLAVHCKGVELPAHIGRGQQSLALAYAITPIGADHESSIHDGAIGPSTADEAMENLAPLGILERMDPSTLDENKVRFLYYGEIAYSMVETLALCHFCVNCFGYGLWTYPQVSELVAAVTGWQTSLWELLKAGERRINLLRAFNVLAGQSEDILPERLFQPIEGGTAKGLKVDREAFKRAREFYYEMSGWSSDSGVPSRAKLVELGLPWVADIIENTQV